MIQILTVLLKNIDPLNIYIIIPRSQYISGSWSLVRPGCPTDEE